MGIYKKAVSLAKKGRGKVIKRYFKKKSNYAPKLSTMYKDIMKVKGMLNAEKKQISNTVAGAIVGQCSINNADFRTYDITPVPAQGSGQGNRTGNSIKCCSSYALFQFIQQVSTATSIKLKIMFILPMLYQSSPSTFITSIFEASSWSTIIDYNSQLNPNYRGQYKILRTVYKTVTLTPYSSAKTVLTFKIPMKWNHHIRYGTDGSNVPTDGQILMVMLADSGNSSATVSTLQNIPIQTASSGLQVNFDWNWFYYDN